ncbi:MAG TPA: hypothetical protein PLN53_03760, partial [Terricaulis sp.]|nr:hypothetical protein [Terricaulis sp.]
GRLARIARRRQCAQQAARFVSGVWAIGGARVGDQLGQPLAIVARLVNLRCVGAALQRIRLC